MRILIQLFLVALIAVTGVSRTLAQNDDPAQIQQLNSEMSDAFRKQNYDEAIRTGEKILRTLRQTRSGKPEAVVTALENLGEAHLFRLKQASSHIADPTMKTEDRRKFVEQIGDDAKQAEQLFRDALTMTDRAGGVPAAQKESIRINLAWLMWNYFPTNVAPPDGFDQHSRDVFKNTNMARVLGRVTEASRLYQDVVRDTETGDVDQFLIALYDLAEFESATADFESAIATYERCIGVVEARFGKQDKNLVPLLESYSKALVAVGRDADAFEAVSRIVRISRQSAKLPSTLSNISLRSENSFAVANAPSVESRAGANQTAIETQLRGALVQSRSDIIGPGVLANSTRGKYYYENSSGQRVFPVPVRVVVDGTGRVIEDEALTPDKELKELAEKIVKTWTFKPYSGPGGTHNIRGYVECLFASTVFAN